MGFNFAGKAVYSAVWVAAVSLFMELLGFSTQKWVTAGGLGTVLLTLAGREVAIFFPWHCKLKQLQFIDHNYKYFLSSVYFCSNTIKMYSFFQGFSDNVDLNIFIFFLIFFLTQIFTNFLSSVMIHATRPFVVNEWIQTKIEGYEVSGTVEVCTYLC